MFYRAIIYWEEERSHQALPGTFLNLESWERRNSRGSATFDWSHHTWAEKRGHWLLQITLGTSCFLCLIAMLCCKFNVIFSILTTFSNNAFRYDSIEQLKYLPLVQMSKSPYDKYNIVKKYFDLVPADKSSETWETIWIFHQVANIWQMQVCFCLSTNLSINSYSFSPNSTNLRILFSFLFLSIYRFASIRIFCM